MWISTDAEIAGIRQDLPVIGGNDCRSVLAPACTFDQCDDRTQITRFTEFTRVTWLRAKERVQADEGSAIASAEGMALAFAIESNG